ncbi:ribitol-5-phosphate dehydrogenase [Vagococcus fluvialis]|uniref:ribitol-5-phosphate dehydrogenase n=1 Tax=Vagococcus fluvialis TaxID=2738 RepID=UPI003B59B4C4
MLNQVYRLVSPKQFEAITVNEEVTDETLIIRPTYLSICHADQRYFTGTRGKEAMAKKLPMALIHEGIGKVIHDPKGEYKNGEYVVMVPNTPVEEDEVIHENYLKSTKFRSSGYDGYMQEYVFLRRDRAVRIPEDFDLEVSAFLELISVAFHTIKRAEKTMNGDKSILAVWGDGNLGYITSLLLSRRYPESKIYVFGKHEMKLEYFSFADSVFSINQIPEDLEISHAFECTGGMGSQYAVKQIIDHIKPEGTIALMGVSENPIEINTRMVLERGLTLIGSSRSGVEDFKETIEFLAEHPGARRRLRQLVGIRKKIVTIEDMISFFEDELTNSWGKAVMQWEV